MRGRILWAALALGVLGDGRAVGSAESLRHGLESRKARMAAPGLDKPGPVPRPPRLSLAAEQRIDGLVDGALRSELIPGCVVLIGDASGTLFQRAYGRRALQPEPQPARPDTLYDLASLTKVVATTTSVALLIHRGKLSLSEPIARFLPEFAGSNVRISHLLTHSSGLPADNALASYDHGAPAALAAIGQLRRAHAPGEHYEYSDLGFILLGEIVARVSGQSLAAFSVRELFAPLGMRDTGFSPDAARAARAASNRTPGDELPLGVVHDPRARLLGGEAGHAGLFSTAADLERFARLWLARGELDGQRLLSRATVDRFLSIRSFGEERRGLGWDLPNQAEQLAVSPRTFGHTGFTGTALWVDPQSERYIVFLSNRLHSGSRGKLQPLVWQIFAAARGAVSPPSQAPAPLVGIDVLRRDRFRSLAGLRVALVTHDAARARDGARSLDVLAQTERLKLVKVFSLEHGLASDREGAIGSNTDLRSGLPVESLYGERVRPTRRMLAGLDALLFDVQDVGVRFFTYISSLKLILEAAAQAGVRVIVLDRPNPLGGARVEGPVAEAGELGFVNPFPLPVRHGMTVGELARLFASELGLKVRLEVIEMQGYQRQRYFDEQALRWIRPSPNLRSIQSVLLYPALGLLERTNLSVGRGTPRPFEWFGAPWLDAPAMLSALAEFPGISLSVTSFIPDSGPFRGERCQALRIGVSDRARFQPFEFAVALVRALQQRHAGEWHGQQLNDILANRTITRRLLSADDPAAIRAQVRQELARFLLVRQRYLLYGQAP